MYGTQTAVFTAAAPTPFENDVKMYGTQTLTNDGKRVVSLRMM